MQVVGSNCPFQAACFVLLSLAWECTGAQEEEAAAGKHTPPTPQLCRRALAATSKKPSTP